MADVITRFKLETTQYDSKLRDAAKSLQSYVHTTESAGKSFTDFSQKSIQAARDLGTVASGATNLKDKVKDLVGAYNDAAKAYNKLSQEQQQSDFGKALAESIGQLSSRIREAKSELDGLGDAMKGAGGGGLFGDDKLDGMLQVFGGNLMTKAFEVATSAATTFISTIKDAAAQGIEMAKSGEGIHLAFERLNRPDLLDNLRQATHGTVTDLELMKQAVKFSDFKLNLDEMGTLLEFAQQKAKDTGQSVDYMVDSIVTGLGRQSLMILDNLGLSASEIRERMKETGDMTSAVASIIRDQMSQAGEYVETAADRAAKADVELKNAMEDLGRTLLPLEQEGTQMFAALELGAIKLLNEGLQPIIPALIELKSTIGDIYDALSNNTVLNGFIDWLSTGLDISMRFVPYLREIRKLLDFSGSGDIGAGASIGASAISGAITADAGTLPEIVVTGHRRRKGGGGGRTDAQRAAEQEQAQRDRIWQQWLNADAKMAHDITLYDGQMMSLAEAQRLMEKKTREQEAATKKLTDAETDRATALQQNDLKAFYAANKKVVGAGGEATNSIDFTYTNNNLDAFIANLKQRISEADVGSELLDSLNDQMADAQTLSNIMETALKNGIDAAQFDPQELFRKIFGDGKTAGDYIKNEVWQNILNQLGQQTGKKFSLDTRSGAVTTGKDGKGGMEQFASDFSKVTGSISSIASGLQNLGVEIPEGLAKTIGVIQTISGILTAILAITTAIQATQTVDTTANMIDAIVPFARGGIVPKAANGYYVPGNSYSGDSTLIAANAGELILNRSAQGNLASQLEGGGMRNLNLTATISGEQIRLALNNYGRRTGNGELITTNFR